MYTPPRVNPFQRPAIDFQTGIQFPHSTPKTQFVDAGNGATFKDVMSTMLRDTDQTLNKPDELMQRALTTGDVDIHEVMIANTKADITVNIASQMVTKIIQAYERVQQIQV